ncbi:MAG: phosphoribosylformylglycinamidine cyclo-ligase, partial [Lentisphaeria bacterium]|nr:phosphoribosylformylglycinamidine cyclo-ligase [Lentisphaeria bacterium]
ALDGIAHITGGGLYDNVPRILPEGIGVVFDKVKSLPVPPIFKLLVEKGNVSHQEAYRVFNMGVGMVWFVPKADEAKALEIARKNGYAAETIGYVEKSSVPVTVVE